MLKSLALAAALSFAAASSAFADGLTVQLQNPVAKPNQVLAGGVVWRCGGATCTTGSEMERTLSVASCRELGKQVGAVAAYGETGRGLGDKELTRCNVGLQGAATQTALAGAR